MIQFSQEQLDRIVAAFAGKRILVIGDLMVDEYLIGSVSRISPEAPVPVVEIDDQTFRLGGAGNVALNVSALGCQAIAAGIIGDDSSGDRLIDLLREGGIDSKGLVRSAKRPTTIKTRIIGDSQHIARVDREKSEYLNPEEEQQLISKLDHLLEQVDGIILQDYNKGVLTPQLINHTIRQANQHDKIIAVDPKFKNFLAYKNVTLFKPNIKETESALAIKIHNEQDLIQAGQVLRDTLRAHSVLITRGAAGMTLFEDDGTITHVPTRARKVADVSGAGDTVISALTAALIGGATFQEAATLANFAAGIVCEEVGIVPVDKDKLYQVCLGRDN